MKNPFIETKITIKSKVGETSEYIVHLPPSSFLYLVRAMGAFHEELDFQINSETKNALESKLNGKIFSIKILNEELQDILLNNQNG